MTEQFILQYVPERIRQLGYRKHYTRYRDFVVDGGSSVSLPAYNELYFIVDDPPGVIVESDYGLYDTTDNPVHDNVHQHRGEITIRNTCTEKRRIKFIQVIIVN